MLFKNTASQKAIYFAFDATTNVPKTGDAANITPYVSKDYGAVTAITDTSATEMDATNAPGYYLVDLTQGETNAEVLLFSAKSATANIKVIGAPAVVFPMPTLGVLSPATLGRTLVVDASGLADANAVKVGPSGSGTAQTAGDLKALIDAVDNFVDTEIADIQSRLPAALGANGHMMADLRDYLGTASPAPTVAGVPEVDVTHVAGTVQTPGDLAALITAVDNFIDTEVDAIKTVTDQLLALIGTPVTSLAAMLQIIDDFTDDIGAAGAGLTAIPDSAGVGTLLTRLTALRAAALDEVTAARMGALTDWINGGRLDLILDIIAADTTTDIPALIAAVQADLPAHITKNTALAGFTFLMVLASDHVTPATGLTITATRSLDGAAFGACANSASEVSAGVYKIDLAAADLNGNTVMLKFTSATADARYVLIATQPT